MQDMSLHLDDEVERDPLVTVAVTSEHVRTYLTQCV